MCNGEGSPVAWGRLGLVQRRGEVGESGPCRVIRNVGVVVWVAGMTKSGGGGAPPPSSSLLYFFPLPPNPMAVLGETLIGL